MWLRRLLVLRTEKLQSAQVCTLKPEGRGCYKMSKTDPLPYPTVIVWRVRILKKKFLCAPLDNPPPTISCFL